MSRITAVLSKNSGGGKSHFIQRKITEMKKESPEEIVEIEISISGEVNIHSLAKRASILHNLMKEAKKNNQKVVIVCKLDYIENFKKYVNIIDYFFFCLCFLGSVHIAEGIGILDQNDIKHIFVEIGNSTKEDILAEIQVVKYLKKVEILNGTKTQ
jgi:hypothetical protein